MSIPDKSAVAPSAPTLQSAALWSGAATLTRLAVGFLSIKVTAVYLGPAGLAFVGQIGNFVTLLQSTLGNAVNSAVVKISSESSVSNPERAAGVTGTALRLICVIGAMAGMIVFLLHRPLATWLLGDSRFFPIMVALSISLPLLMLGNLAVALFNAQRRFALVSGTHIAATLAGAALFLPMCWLYGLWGGLIALVLSYPVTFLIAQVLGRRETGTNLLSHWSSARREHLRPILAFYPMLLTHSVALPLSLLLVRDLLIGTFGADQAGFWQASVRLSDMYTMVFIAALSMYSLPTLSAAQGTPEFRRILRQLVLTCLGVAAGGALALFLLRDLVVRIVFTPEFAPVTALWSWQLLGDVFLIAGWPMRSALMARGRNKTYMLVEASIGIGFFALTRLMLDTVGLAAANVAHAAVWGLVFVVLVVLHHDTLLRARS